MQDDKLPFRSKMDQLGLSNRTQKALITYGFNSVEEVRDFINEYGITALRTAKAGFGTIVCEELSRLPFLIQTYQEAKRVIKLVESLQSEIEMMDIVFKALEDSNPTHFKEVLEEAKATPEYRKLVSRAPTK